MKEDAIRAVVHVAVEAGAAEAEEDVVHHTVKEANQLRTTR
jgi:hypothetical protein